MGADGLVVYGYDFSGLDGGALVNTPKHAAQLTIDWRATQRLDTYVTFAYRGEVRQAIKLGGVPTLGAEPRDGSFQVDVGAAWDVASWLTLKAAVLNLTDDVNYEPGVDGYQYIEDGRRYWIGATARF